MTEKHANELFNKWVKRLHLESWDIRFKWKVRSANMALSDSVGCTTFNHTSKQAIIEMLDPIDFDNDLFTYDYEKTLVHELLHLKFADLDNSGDPLRDKLTHQLIDGLAKSFVDS